MVQVDDVDVAAIFSTIAFLWNTILVKGKL